MIGIGCHRVGYLGTYEGSCSTEATNGSLVAHSTLHSFFSVLRRGSYRNVLSFVCFIHLASFHADPPHPVLPYSVPPSPHPQIAADKTATAATTAQFTRLNFNILDLSVPPATDGPLVRVLHLHPFPLLAFL